MKNIILKDINSEKLEGVDFIFANDKIIIYNVPIVAELVQPYNNGFAYKSADEINKISVINTPVTMLSDVADHPNMQLADMSPTQRTDVQVGYLTEPSKPKTTDSDKKRYADMVLDDNDLTRTMLDAYKAGTIVDVSIGFSFEYVADTGVFDGVNYDYKQTNIKLDHLAILMDASGNIAQGRMPSPIGGIGADSENNGVKMTNQTNDAFAGELSNLVSTLQANNTSLNRQDVMSLLQDQLWLLRENEGFDMKDKKDIASLTEENKQLKDKLEESNAKLSAIDSVKVQSDMDALKTAKDEAEKKLEEAETKKEEAETKLAEKETETKEISDKLNVFEEKAKTEMDAKRTALKEANKDMADLFDSASDDMILKYHEKLVQSQSDSNTSRSIGADMNGVDSEDEAKKDLDRFNSYTGKTNK